MSENLGPSPEELGIETSESRFGNKEVLVQAMEHGSAEVLGRIEDFHNVPPHRNVVEWAYVKHEMITTRNVSELVVIDDENGHHLECVFKPIVGEDEEFHKQNGLGHDYSREVASYLVSEHFGFDFVPPTTLRQIGNKVGSLQLFMPEDKYQLGSEAMHNLPIEREDELTDSDELKKLCLFDWIIANADRHVNNYMFKIDEEGQVDFSNGLEVIAIDNGMAFNEQFYRIKGGPSRNDLPGPYQFLTRDNETNTSVTTPIPEELYTIIKNGFENKDQLTETLLSLPDIEPKEIEAMWKRVEGLIDSGVFLSGYNYKEHIKSIKK